MSGILLKDIGQLVTVSEDEKLYKVSSEMQDVGVVKHAAMYFTDKIEWLGTSEEVEEFI